MNKIKKKTENALDAFISLCMNKNKSLKYQEEFSNTSNTNFDNRPLVNDPNDQTHPGAMHPSELVVGFQRNPDQTVNFPVILIY